MAGDYKLYQLSGFFGWMPVARFHSQGQAESARAARVAAGTRPEKLFIARAGELPPLPDPWVKSPGRPAGGNMLGQRYNRRRGGRDD
jgi:hypothetical protein